MQNYFLSFWSGDKDWARALHSNLEAHGLSGFFSEEDIHGGAPWIDEVERALAACERLVLVWSPEAAVRPRIRDEWQTIIDKRPEWAAEGRILVVVHADAPRPTYIRRAQALDFTEPKKYVQSLDKLLTALGSGGPRLAQGTLEQPPPGHPRLDAQLRRQFEQLLAPLTRTPLTCAGFESELRLPANSVKQLPEDERASALLALACMPPQSAGDGARSVLELLRANDTALEPTARTSLDALARALELWRPPAAEDPLLPYLRRARDAHGELLPFFRSRVRRAGLEQVYVELDLREEHAGAEPTRDLKLVDLLKRAPRRWVVRGDPGAGKTTLLRHVVFEKASTFDQQAVPVFLTLRNLLAQSGAGWARVRAHLEHHGESAALDGLELARSEGRLALLLDGLDEVDDAVRGQATNLVRQLHDALGDSTLVVTTRRIGYSRAPLPAPFVVADVQRMEQDQQTKMLAEYLKPEAAERRGPGEWVRELNANPGLAEDAANPLLLTLMAIVINRGGAPGPRRGQLYDQVLDALLADEHHEPPEPLPLVDWVRAALVEIAASMTVRGEIDSSPTVLERALLAVDVRMNGQFLAPAAWGAPAGTPVARWVLERLRRAGVVGPYRGDSGHWGFWHRSFQEALTAKHLAALGVEQAVKLAAGVNDRVNLWAESFAFLAGEVERPDELILTLAASNPSVALRAVASSEKLTPKTIEAVLGLTEDIEERGKLLLQLRDKLGDPLLSLRLLDQIRRSGATPDDLYFIDQAFTAIGVAEPELAREAAQRRARLFDHLPKPDGPLFETVETGEGVVSVWSTIPAGRFTMGSKKGGDDERPAHKVELRLAFDLFRTPVTRGQYSRFDPPSRARGGNERDPITRVSWYAATMFCRWLGARLPSESEWEYACRAGTTTEYWSGDKEKDLARVGWYAVNSVHRVHAVGEKPASPWGLFDMHGNVWEWCEDTWPSDYKTAPTDGSAWVDQASSLRVIRGGSFEYPAEDARSAYRYRRHRSDRWDSAGFRPARSVTTD